jgi:hypothetical protein
LESFGTLKAVEVDEGVGGAVVQFCNRVEAESVRGGGGRGGMGGGGGYHIKLSCGA